VVQHTAVGWGERCVAGGAERAKQSAPYAALRPSGSRRCARLLADERTRIARKLHDVVGHALGVMVIRADGAKRVVGGDPKQAKDAMETIEETGRQGLAEMRRLVKLIRDTPGGGARAAAEPDPAARLRGGLREAGLSVRVRVVGEPVPIAPGSGPRSTPTGSAGRPGSKLSTVPR